MFLQIAWCEEGIRVSTTRDHPDFNSHFRPNTPLTLYTFSPTARDSAGMAYSLTPPLIEWHLGFKYPGRIQLLRKGEWTRLGEGTGSVQVFRAIDTFFKYRDRKLVGECSPAYKLGEEISESERRAAKRITGTNLSDPLEKSLWEQGVANLRVQLLEAGYLREGR